MSIAYIFKIVVFLLVSVLAFLIWYLVKASQKAADEKKKRDAIIKVKTKNNRLYAIYKRLIRVKFTRKYIQRLQASYEIRIPGDLRQSREKATLTAIIIWSVYIIAVAILCFLRPSLLAWATVLYTAYVVADQIVRTSLAKMDIKLILQLGDFIDDVRFHYMDRSSVEEAIELSLDKAPRLIKMHGEKILSIITSYDMDSDLAKYCEVAPNYFIKMFADTCSKIVKYGDKIVEDQSLFLRSIQALKEEIQIEQLRQIELDSKFTLMNFVVVAPIYCIQPLINFGNSSYEALNDLYAGSYGVAATVICFIVDFAVYRIMLILRDRIHINLQKDEAWDNIYEMKPIKKVVDGYLVKNWGKAVRMTDLLKKTGSTFTAKTFLIKRFVYALVAFILFNCLFVFSCAQEKRLASSNVSSVSTSSTGSTDTECLEMLFIARQLLENYKTQDLRKQYNASVGGGTNAAMEFDSKVTDFLKTKLNEDLKRAIKIDKALAYSQVQIYIDEHSSSKIQLMYLDNVPYEEAVKGEDEVSAGYAQFESTITLASRKQNGLTDKEKEEIVNVVAKQVKKYQSSYFKWHHLFAASVLSVIAYFLPLLILLYEKKSLQMDMDDEVIQYKSSIMLLMHFNRMTTEVILESMLLISNIFKKSLQKCVGNLPLDENYAYDELIKDEPFNSFHRLIENLRMVDRVGVKRAFDTVASERKNYQEMRKQENTISVNKRGTMAVFISMLPAYFVIGGYMIVPFVIAAVQKFQESMNMSAQFM